MLDDPDRNSFVCNFGWARYVLCVSAYLRSVGVIASYIALCRIALCTLFADHVRSNAAGGCRQVTAG